jgi:hypothetical protein
MVTMQDGDEEPLHLSPGQVEYLRKLKVEAPFIGGPKDGAYDEKLKVFKAPFDRVFFINKKYAHYYTLEGCLDDGFYFKYRGVWTYKCLGRGKYEVLKEYKGKVLD